MLSNIKYFIPLISLVLITFSSQTIAQKAPDFTLPGDNGEIKLSQYKNKVVYIDFWASWCKPCRKSFSFMNEMQDRHGKEGLKIIAINLDEDKSAAHGFLQDHPAKFTIAYDATGKTPSLYQLKVMPTSYLIDRKGNLINIHKGFKENQTVELEKLITQALKK